MERENVRGPRRGAGERDPELPDGVTASALDKNVRGELSGLGKDLAASTGAHLAAVAYFIDDDPEQAWAHAVAARKRAGRLGIVRETAGLAAYRAGLYAEALSELRTARRITGSNQYLPVIADSERGLGRPERAIDIAHGPEANELDRDGRIELLIVESGARADLGDHEAAVVVLEIPELNSKQTSPTLARLRFAYSEALNRAEREKEADAWRERAMADDPEGVANLYPAEDDEIYDLLEDDEDEGTDGEEDDPEDEQFARAALADEASDDLSDDEVGAGDQDEQDDEDDEQADNDEADQQAGFDDEHAAYDQVNEELKGE